MKLNAKIALMGAGSVLLTAIALVAVAVWQSDLYNKLAQQEVDVLINADLDHITQGVYNLVRTENEAVQSQVDSNLNVARHLLAGAGGVRLAPELIEWTATNQFSKEGSVLRLPKFVVGEQWIGTNREVSVETPIVDQVTRLVGETATIFQRMNEQGDMLRVATTVQTAAGERAIGTYIPAVEPGGAANPVIAAVLRGETYHGRAYVVNDWYLTAYEPIHDSAGQLVGMLYVGVKKQAVAARIRHAILQTNVGRTGYVYVLGGGGEDRGRYIISQRGERDGEDIWSTRDSDGRAMIQEIITKAVQLKPGEMTTVRYRWQNPGESEPRWKVARLVYYAPWDWVIGTSVHEDELQLYSRLLSQGRGRMVKIMAVAGVAITVLIGMAALLIAWSIMRPIRQMTVVAEKIIAGDLSQVVQVRSQDEIGMLARTFNHMTGELNRSMDGLRKSEEKYRSIFENALEGLYQSSLEGRFLNANPALAHILGYDSPQALIDGITDIRHQFYVNPSDRDTVLAAISQYKKMSGIEVQCYRRDGSIIWVSISASLCLDESGHPTVIEGFITDITARKQAEEALVESRNYLTEIINSVGDPIFVKDVQHRWVLVNDALCAFMDHSRDELLGKSDYDFFPKEQADVFWATDELVFVSGEVHLNEEMFTDGRGTLHVILTKKVLYIDKKGERFIVGIIRDITEQKQAEAERLRLEARLRQSQKMEAIGTLAGGIAHDFNNILQPMLGYSELLKKELAADSRHQRYVDRLYTAGLRAKDLVNQILAFSRQSEHRILPVRIQTGLKEILKLCRSTIPSTIAIHKDIQEDCASVLLDPTQLHQIVMNLIVNASHAVEQCGGEISVGLHEVVLGAEEVANSALLSGHYARLTVADTGCGIEPAILDKIFEPYFTTKGQGKGTGLGLAMVYGIVKEQHGEIRVQSEVGKGTAFQVYLPVVDDAVEVARPEQGLEFPTGHERILLVDDEELILEVGRLILEGLGYRVTTQRNSVEALDLFKADPMAFDLVITDMTMPRMTGEQLAGALLAIKPALPIIICSGYSERMSRERAKTLGVKLFLMKPITILEMSQKVRLALDEAMGAAPPSPIVPGRSVDVDATEAS